MHLPLLELAELLSVPVNPLRRLDSGLRNTSRAVVMRSERVARWFRFVQRRAVQQSGRGTRRCFRF
jgi:hypothetical protein